MDKNLVIVVSLLSRLAVPLDIGEDSINIKGTSIVITCVNGDINITCDTLPPLCLEFGDKEFDTELFVCRLHQALHSELDIVTTVIIEGIYNTVKTIGLPLNNIFIENDKTNNTALVLPVEGSISIIVFKGLVSNGDIKSTMVLPLANDPLRYINIIKSIS